MCEKSIILWPAIGGAFRFSGAPIFFVKKVKEKKAVGENGKQICPTKN